MGTLLTICSVILWFHFFDTAKNLSRDDMKVGTIKIFVLTLVCRQAFLVCSWTCCGKIFWLLSNSRSFFRDLL